MFDRLRPHRIARRLHEIDCDDLRAHDVRGVILDLDGTLTPWKSIEVPAEVETWLRRLRDAGIAACLVSNAASTRRVVPVATHLGLPYILRAAKPLPRGFRQGMAVMGTTPATTAVVGDQVFTDILGGNRLGLFTVLVDPMSSTEALVTRMIQRPLERLVGRVAKG